MNKMLELIRSNSVPAPMMRKAVAGQLALPLAEQLEILIFLARQDGYSTEALDTLASWDDEAVRKVCSDPGTPEGVIRYFLVGDLQRRPALLSLLIQHPSVNVEALLSVAQTANLEEIETLLNSRAHSMPAVLRAILVSPCATAMQKADCQQLLSTHSDDAAAAFESDDVLNLLEVVAKYEVEHASEIAAEEGKRFELTRGHPEEQDEIAEMLSAVEPEECEQKVAPKPKKPDEPERLSVIQKIARLTVGERVQCAMKGTKDERFVLIRDGSRVVSLAVLESPKATDTEVESYAAMKNVQEAVLRGIAAKRKFMKKYAIVRALVSNPKTPLDLGLSLLPHLLTVDLKNLSANKNVGETLRKVANKLWRDKQKKN
jgi:hypothetical protein